MNKRKVHLARNFNPIAPQLGDSYLNGGTMSKPKHKYKTKARLEIAIQALKQIRTMGYDSQAHRATETVLACIRVSEDALLEIE